MNIKEILNSIEKIRRQGEETHNELISALKTIELQQDLIDNLIKYIRYMNS